MLRRRWPLALFAVWTLYVWTTRIVNAWSASDESTTAKVVSTVVAVALLAGAVAIIASLVRARSRPLTVGEIRLVGGEAVLTAAVWLVRIVTITTDANRDVPFKVVHVVLGVISLGLAAAAWTVANRDRAAARGTGATSASDPVPVSTGATPHR